MSLGVITLEGEHVHAQHFALHGGGGVPSGIPDCFEMRAQFLPLFYCTETTLIDLAEVSVL